MTKPKSRVTVRPDIELGSHGSKWKHGWLPLNAVAAAIKAKKFRHEGGGSGKSRIDVQRQAAHALAAKGKARPPRQKAPEKPRTMADVAREQGRTHNVGGVFIRPDKGELNREDERNLRYQLAFHKASAKQGRGSVSSQQRQGHIRAIQNRLDEHNKAIRDENKATLARNREIVASASAPKSETAMTLKYPSPAQRSANRRERASTIAATSASGKPIVIAQQRHVDATKPRAPRGSKSVAGVKMHSDVNSILSSERVKYDQSTPGRAALAAATARHSDVTKTHPKGMRVQFEHPTTGKKTEGEVVGHRDGNVSVSHTYRTGSSGFQQTLTMHPSEVKPSAKYGHLGPQPVTRAAPGTKSVAGVKMDGQQKIGSASAVSTPKVSHRITASTYRGQTGHQVSQFKDGRKGSSVFVPGDRSEAEKVRDRMKAGKSAFGK